MNRRTLLKGVAVGSAGSIVSATRVGAARTERQSVGSGQVSVRITETPDAVVGGAPLEWTVELANPTDEPVRPTVEYAVDDESLGSATLSVEPGETVEPTTPTYRTQPVAAADAVTIRVDAGGSSAAQTVDLLAPQSLAGGLRVPDSASTVSPGTTVQFEVGSGDPDTAQTTSWWVDGERVGDSLADPWQSSYYAERGRHYRQETFETAGSHEVVAGVEIGGEQYRASWTVAVADDGRVGPRLEAATPERGVLAVDPGEPTTVAVDVADPNGSLERVVWWTVETTELLGVSEVSGAADTATLVLEGERCHGCHVVAWALTSDGTVTEDTLWRIARTDRDGESEPAGSV